MEQKCKRQRLMDKVQIRRDEKSAMIAKREAEHLTVLNEFSDYFYKTLNSNPQFLEPNIKNFTVYSSNGFKIGGNSLIEHDIIKKRVIDAFMSKFNLGIRYKPEGFQHTSNGDRRIDIVVNGITNSGQIFVHCFVLAKQKGNEYWLPSFIEYGGN